MTNFFNCISLMPKVTLCYFFKAGLRLETSLLSLPSSQFNNYERFSAIQRDPQNTHHYLVATDQSLVILDDRFVQSPVLKWHHHLRTPAQFLQVVHNLFPDCDDGVIVISGSRHYESHCYQYCPEYEDTQSSMMLTGGKNILPPSSTSLQWKASNLIYHIMPFAGQEGQFCLLVVSLSIRDELTDIGLTN